MRVFKRDTEPFLLFGGLLSALAALLHIAIIIGGAEWYRFFGAGEEMATMAAEGSMFPAIVTFLIALMLTSWAIYAVSGAGLIQRLPYVRLILVLIAALYLVRGLGVVPLYYIKPEMVDDFLIWSSIISTIYGLTYAIGTGRQWNELGERRRGGDRRARER